MNLTLDRLEGRDCPAVTVVQQGQFVYITGDRADDAVAVRDLGDNRIGVDVGKKLRVLAGARWLRADLGGGDNAFTFTYPDRPSAFLDTVLSLGTGDDRALFQHKSNVNPSPAANLPSEYKFDVRGGPDGTR